MSAMTATQRMIWYRIGWSLFGLSLALVVAGVVLAIVFDNAWLLLGGATGVYNAASCYLQLKRGPR